MSHQSNCVAPDKKGLGKVRFCIVCLGPLIKMMGWKDLINKCEGIIIHMVWWHTIVFLYTIIILSKSKISRNASQNQKRLFSRAKSDDGVSDDF